MIRFKIIMLLVVSLAVTGCVTGTRNIDLTPPEYTAKQSASGSIYIVQVTDNRQFEAKPKDPSVPSVDGDLSKTAKEKLSTLIGRQRNGFGAAMGDVALPEGGTVQQEMKDLVASGLKQRGYSITENADAPIKLKITVEDFWAWFSPGMWSVSFESKLKSHLEFDKDGESRKITVEGYGLNKGQIASDANWALAYKRAFLDFFKKLEVALDKAEL